jgi:hypothetical protein
MYWCAVDSATLFVDEKALIKRKEFLVKLTEEEIATDSDLELRNGKLFVTSWESYFPMEQKGDTVISSVILRDTLFAIDAEQVLKPFRGHLILNTKLDDQAWAVMVVSHRGPDRIVLARADLPEDISRLDSITPVRTLAKRDEKETQILITPTKEEFDLILQRRLLFDSSCTEFERIFPLRIDQY